MNDCIAVTVVILQSVKAVHRHESTCYTAWKTEAGFFFYDGLPRDHLTNHRDNKMVEICISVCCAFAFCLPTSIIQNLSFLWREGARGLILSQEILLFSVNTCVEKGWSCADPLVSHFAWLLFFPVKVQNWKSHALCLGVACLSSLTEWN